MRTTVLNTEEASNKFWAYRDARMRNYANSTLYNDRTRVRAERMKLALELVYRARAIYIAYGKTGISIKVDQGVCVYNKDLALLEADWALQGVEKRVSAQGVIYRFREVH